MQKPFWILAVGYTTRTVLLCLLPPTVFGLAGRWVDHHLRGEWPVGSIIGLFLAMYVTYRLMLREAARYKDLFPEPPTKK